MCILLRELEFQLNLKLCIATISVLCLFYRYVTEYGTWSIFAAAIVCISSSHVTSSYQTVIGNTKHIENCYCQIAMCSLLAHRTHPYTHRIPKLANTIQLNKMRVFMLIAPFQPSFNSIFLGTSHKVISSDARTYYNITRTSNTCRCYV